MKDILVKTLKIIEEKNKKQRIISPEEYLEQEENVQDFKKLKDTVFDQLNEIEKNQANNNELIRNLLKLHMQYCDLIWHYEQIQGLLNKLITSYDFDSN